MSSKQDLVAARTAQDVERKYNFGKTFAEVMGMAEEAQKAAEKAQEAADNATGAVEDLDQKMIFNLLTNNGEIQGLFMKDGQIYVNVSYLATGVITSADGSVSLDLANNEVTIATNIDGQEGKIVLSAYGATFYGLDATTGELQKFLRMWPGYITSDGTDYTSMITTPYLQASLHIQANKRLLLGNSSADLTLYGKSITIDGKTVSWKDNGDGTYSLIGEDS